MFKKKKLRKIYLKGININQYLRKFSNIREKEIIKLSYDIQSGSYVKKFNYKKSKTAIKELILEVKNSNFNSLLDFGCGELTNFYTLIKNINCKKKKFFAFDLSFSRISEGINFLKKKNISLDLNCFALNSYQIPLPDNSIDIITSCHGIEPNNKGALKILKELYRVAKKKIILLEPHFELTEKMNNKKKIKTIKNRFIKHNYVKELSKKIKKITSNYKIIPIKKPFNKYNPSSLFIIKKKTKINNIPKFNNPKEKSDLLKQGPNIYYSSKTGEIFPIINNIVMFKKDKMYSN